MLGAQGEKGPYSQFGMMDVFCPYQLGPELLSLPEPPVLQIQDIWDGQRSDTILAERVRRDMKGCRDRLATAGNKADSSAFLCKGDAVMRSMVGHH